jgi:hypothetical protein
MRVGSGLVGVIRPGAFGARILIRRTTRLLDWPARLLCACVFSGELEPKVVSVRLGLVARHGHRTQIPERAISRAITSCPKRRRSGHDRGSVLALVGDELAPGLRLSLIASLMDGIDRRRVSTQQPREEPESG